MRILLIIEGFRSLGGVQEVVDHLASELLRLGHAVALVSTPFVEPGCERTPQSRVECVYMDIPAAKPVSLRHLERVVRQPKASDLIRFIREWRPTIVSSHLWPWDKFPTVVDACKETGLPLVQSLYDNWGEGKTGRVALRSLRHANALTALSQATRLQFEKLAPCARNARVILPGVDFKSAEAALPYSRPRPYILCAARLELRQKAIDLLISAFAEIAGDYTGVDLLISGEGPDHELLIAQAQDLGLQDRIEFLGLRSRAELWSLFKGATLFAMPSRAPEGLGLVFLEAMAAGIPVIGTRSGGTPEVIAHGENGLLVNRGSRRELADTLRTLLSDPALRSSMGGAGHRMVADHFNWTVVARQFVEVYASCI